MKQLIILLTVICAGACHGGNSSNAIADTQQRPDSICLYYSLYDAHSILFKENTDVWSFVNLYGKKMHISNEDIIGKVYTAYKQLLSNRILCPINDETKELYPDVLYALVFFNGKGADTLGIDFKKNTAILFGEKEAGLIDGKEDIYGLQCIIANILRVTDPDWLLENKGNFKGTNSEHQFRIDTIEKWIVLDSLLK